MTALNGPGHWTVMGMDEPQIRGLVATLQLIERSTSKPIESVCYLPQALTISVAIAGASTPLTWSW